MPDIKITILKKTVNGVTQLELQPLSQAAQQQIAQRRQAIPPNKQALLNIAFQNARRDPRHAGDTEPLLVLSRAMGDTLTWLVLDGNNPQPGFIVAVHPFSTLGIFVPDHRDLLPQTPVPPVFDGFPQESDSHGLVHSGLPTEAAANHPFGWHKFTVTLGDAVLDPCIFV